MVRYKTLCLREIRKNAQKKGKMSCK